MRTIGLLTLFLFLSFPAERKSNFLLNQQQEYSFRIPHLNLDFLELKKKDVVTDTVQLKKSSWYTDAIRNIEESEYEIKYDDVTHSYASPNRKHNLRSFYTSNNFTLLPRNDSTDNWELTLATKGIFADNKLVYTPDENAVVINSGKNIRFNHAGNFITEYINSKEGVRQNFIIEKEPCSKPKTISVKLQASKGWFINQVHPKEIHFAKEVSDKVEKKVTYNGLKAWDANNQELEANFSVMKDEVLINVYTENAAYPVTIDPLSTGTSGTPDWVGDDADQANAEFGDFVSSAGDVNGDGYSDVIIAATMFDDGPNINEGVVFIYHGSITGLSSSPNNILADADQADAYFGYSISTAGDVNGDGYSDVIVGAYSFNDGPYNEEGRAFVYYGSASGLSTIANSILEDADQTGARFGWSVSSAGDVNGDGYSDVIIGAPLYDDSFVNEGKAFIYHGSASGLSANPDATPDDADQLSAEFGYSVAGAGDVNGDGYSDVIIGADSYNDGANTDEGWAFVYHGSTTGLNTIANSILDDCNQGVAFFGTSVASAGDINGDGYSDVIIGAFLFDDENINEGRAFVYYGSATGLSVIPGSTPDDANQGSSGFGFSVACAGDVNGDGYSDVIIGAYLYNDNFNQEGKAFVYYGSAVGLSTTPDSTPDDADQLTAHFGDNVSSAGDVNGDGYSDVIITADEYDDGVNGNEGRAFVYHGSPDGLSYSPINTPDDADQLDAQFGVSVASAGDVNGDGYSDVIIGAWVYDDAGNTNEGRAYVYHGSASGLSATPNWIGDDADQANALFGETVASAGDVNGDGYSDVIIGADNYDDGPNSNEGRAFVYHGSASGLSAAPDWVGDDADQANAFFGVSLNSAGDVNGDGYGDVIVGAIGMTDGGNPSEGKAYVYHGSASGLSTSPNSTPDDADQANAWFGWSVASAGDVNGDGYSDVIIGAPTFDDSPNTDEGRAFVYHGSPAGVNATPSSTPDDANQAGVWFGECVAVAGDVNGDGYSDVIISARLYDDAGNTDEGRAFVYHGSSSGLSTSPNSTPDDADQAGATFGISVASAGDVNGDGYSDVIIGARLYDDGGNTDEGRAFVYYGSSTGLNASPGSTPDDADQPGAYFGYTVACAGDVNGDGYSDVVIGAYLYDDGGNANEGKAFVYYGNNTGGLRNNLRLYNIDLVTPIRRSNIGEGSLFGAGLFGKSPLGRTKARMTWEVKQQGTAFSGNPITNSTSFLSKQSFWTDLGISGAELKNQVQKPGFQNKIRTRIEYDKATAITGQVYGPWRYPPGYLQGAHGMNSVPLPVKFISFTAIKNGTSARLTWTTTNEESGLLYEILYSTDDRNYFVLASLNGKGDATNQYNWTHHTPSTGKNYYRIRAVEKNKESLTSVRMVYFDENASSLVIYPRPCRSNQWLSIKGFAIKQNETTRVVLINNMGQVIRSETVTATADNYIRVMLPALAGGIYYIRVGTADLASTEKIIVEK